MAKPGTMRHDRQQVGKGRKPLSARLEGGKVSKQRQLNESRGQIWAIGERVLYVQWGLVALAIADLALHAVNYYFTFNK